MKYPINFNIESLRIKENDALIVQYISDYKRYLESMHPSQAKKECISGYNRMQRMSLWSNLSEPGAPKIGDICYIDFGHMYINEAGYQHFGLIVSIFHHKICVIPMTSNRNAVNQAINVRDEGKHHLFYIGQLEGLNKPSVLFLNDCRFLNASRIISINAKIEPSSKMFQSIMNHLKEAIFGLE